MCDAPVEESKLCTNTAAGFSIACTVLHVSLCRLHKLNWPPPSTLKKFLPHSIPGIFHQDNLINRLSSKLISCGKEARGAGVSAPQDFAIPADSPARLIISQ